MAARCGIERVGLSLTEIVDRCLEQNEAACDAFMREELPKHHSASRTLLSYVLRLPFVAILTTNFDPWLRQQTRANEFGECYVYPGLRLSGGIRKAIFYLHGIFDSDDPNAGVRRLVFGTESFREAYSDSLLPGFLLDVLTFRNVLFIGFNPREEHFAELLRRSSRVRRRLADPASGVLPKRYVLWEAPALSSRLDQARHDAVMAEFQALEVTPCLFDPMGSDRRGLERLLYGWVEEGSADKRPAPFATGFD